MRRLLAVALASACDGRARNLAERDTTADGRRRAQGLLGNDVGVLVLALGANDGLRRVDLDTIEGNLSFIIEKAQARGVQVLLCGMETPPRDLRYTLGFHNLFPRLASRYRTLLVPFLLRGVVLNPDFNGTGSIRIARARNGLPRRCGRIWNHARLTGRHGRAARAAV